MTVIKQPAEKLGLVKPSFSLGGPFYFETKEVHLVLLNQPIGGKAKVPVATDYGMVQHLNLHNSRGIDHVSGYLLIILAGLRIAQSMVMDKNQAGSFKFSGSFFNLAGIDVDAIVPSKRSSTSIIRFWQACLVFYLHLHPILADYIDKPPAEFRAVINA